MSRIVFVLVSRLHLLDLAGPAQVFFTAADPGCDYTLTCFAEEEVVPTAQGLPIRAETSWPELAADDLILIPVGARLPPAVRESRAR